MFNYTIKAIIFCSISAIVLLSGCKKDEEETATPIVIGQEVSVQDSITSNTTWTANNVYLLKGFVYVTNGATLTIEAGTIIKGEKVSKGSLIVKRGSKINAQGTSSKPIVFTSAQAKGSRAPGDWGGIILCGNAPINLPGGQGLVEGGPEAYYGGSDQNDNSGRLEYIRIEYAGIALQPNQEINGLTLAGVGAGTTINHIQISFSGDDSFEWFGGTVKANHLISFKTTDDDFDTDNGYVGNVQFGVCLRDANIADVSGSNGFESDNDASGTSASPTTNAIFSNMSIFGPKQDTSTTVNGNFKRGAHLRRNTKTCIYNSLIAGFPVGLLIDGSLCEANANNMDLNVKHSIIANSTMPLATASGSTFDITTWFNTTMQGNSIVYSSALANDPYNSNSPNFLPVSSSILLSGADFTAPELNSLQTTTYRGAFGTTDWTNGWANWNPQNTDY